MSTLAGETRKDLDPNWGYLHAVSWWEWFIGDVLARRIPRARCGVVLNGDPSRPDPIDAGAPRCPRCIEAGW